MPFLMLGCSYIPGQPGFQVDLTLTSEHASIWSRIRNELVLVWAIPNLLKLFKWTKDMRKNAGVTYPLPITSKPNYIVLINSFFGLEIPRDLPPLAALVGLILADEYPPLQERYLSFLSKHKSVIYIALGSHVILKREDATKIVHGVLATMEKGLIDGVIWAVGTSGRQDFDRDLVLNIGGKEFTFGALLDSAHTDWMFPTYAPQRAILDHESTKLYLTHGGGSSVNEGPFHGKPMIALGIFFDRISNAARLHAGGSAECLDKFTFTSEELREKIQLIIEDKNGNYARNSVRLQRIARIAARRKYLGADLIEEVMYDNELRFLNGRAVKPMHLQTADMRIPFYKVKNWDLMAVTGLVTGLFVGGAWYFGKMVWVHRFIIRRSLPSWGFGL
jgi:UDP:flavonoid glycosyltransferase YjiC (YdhE family)